MVPHENSHAKRKGVLFAMALGLSAIMSAPVYAQSGEAAGNTAESGAAQPATTSTQHGDWVVHCLEDTTAAEAEGMPACQSVQSITVDGQEQPVAQVAFGHMPDTEGLTVTAIVPSNISLPGHIHISGNGEAGDAEEGGVDLTWRRCLGGLCYATADLSSDVVDVMRAGTTGALVFQDARGRAVNLPLSWSGFTAATDSL